MSLPSDPARPEKANHADRSSLGVVSTFVQALRQLVLKMQFQNLPEIGRERVLLFSVFAFGLVGLAQTGAADTKACFCLLAAYLSQVLIQLVMVRRPR